ncbi:ABC transporter ATP-binding protein [Streptomyces sp. NPDC048737]|uniref:ABC transporter ATP-binding protein n=1 Tax=unclassified Streptomyces TaxID=2593676 RepID=UPI003417F315
MSLLLALGSAAAALSVPLMVRELVASLSAHRSVLVPALGMALLAVLSAVASALSAFLLARAGEQMLLGLRVRLMTHVMRLPLPSVRKEGEGNLVARVTSDAALLREVVDLGVVHVPFSAVHVIATLVIMGILDWLLLLVTVGSFTAAGAVVAVVIARARRSYAAQQEAVGALGQQFTAQLGALAVLKANRAETAVVHRLARAAGSAADSAISGAAFQSLVTPVVMLGQQVALVGVVLGGGYRMTQGAVDVSTFAAFLLYLLQMISPVTVVAMGMSQLQTGMAARDRFQKILELEPEPTGPGTAQGAEHAPVESSVAFRDVRFRHPGREVLNGVTFTAPPQGVTALVGPSGAGKSTVLHLVERFVHQEAGEVQVLGRSVDRWPLDRLRTDVAYLDQKFTILEGSVRDNLSLGQREVPTDAQLFAALAAVGLADEVRRLPDGLDTVLGRETDLSGGQRQRLALARITLSPARVVLLDEPTSQLDAANEQRIQHLVEALAVERAVLVVAHRMSTVQAADHVVMLDEGRVLDAGRHEELMEGCEPYRNLVQGRWADDQDALPAEMP